MLPLPRMKNPSTLPSSVNGTPLLRRESAPKGWTVRHSERREPGMGAPASFWLSEASPQDHERQARSPFEYTVPTLAVESSSRAEGGSSGAASAAAALLTAAHASRGSKRETWRSFMSAAVPWREQCPNERSN